MSITVVDTLVPLQYKDNESLVDIKLGDSIQIIPRECFRGCGNLKKVIIPRSIKRIDFRAFADSGLQEVVFEEDSSLRILSPRCFESCSDLTTISLPSSIRIIGNYSFWNCMQLKTKISISENVREVGAFAFALCSSEEIDFHPPTTIVDDNKKPTTLNIGYGAFRQCYKLGSLVLPPHINFIGSAAFSQSGVDNVEFMNDANSTWTLIPQKMFSHCTYLTSIFIPPSITLIGKNAFTASGLEKIEFGSDCQVDMSDDFTPLSTTCNTILRINEAAFSKCTSLRGTVVIPSFVKSIGSSTFANSTLEKIIFSQDSQLQDIPNHMFAACCNLKDVVLPPSILSIGESAFSNSGIDIEVVRSIFANCKIQNIGANAFSHCEELMGTIPIPISIRSIGHSAFEYSSIEKVIFPQDFQLQVIPDHIFADCENLLTVTLPPSVLSIGTSAFARSGINAESVMHIFANCNIQYISDYAFSGCYNLEQITIPSSVSSIGECVFENSNIEKVTFSQDSRLEYLPKRVFARCSMLKSITLPPSINSIGEFAFSSTPIDSKSIAHIFANYNIQTIQRGAFSKCKDLTSIFIPSSVKFIDEYIFADSSIEEVAFSGDSQLESLPASIFIRCHKLKTVTLPSSMTSLGKSVFYDTGIDTESVSKIFASCDIQHIGESAFFHCRNLKAVFIPSSVTSIGDSAFASSNIEEITFSQDSQLDIIDDGIFESCSKLKYIRFPSFTKLLVGKRAFAES